ncbi:MAG: TonB-dependent receptor [Bacteroidia bacterium]|nr:TonB-dependent receptor [Bacteroidia bacterium]
MKISRLKILFSPICLVIIFITVTDLYGQQTTDPLTMDKLGSDDINTDMDIVTRQKVVAASRSLKDLGDLPFTIFVITKEEIERKGYTTLVDALRDVPGIRVSQPGSALDGETFLMRGLLGNAYAKILINSIPIKPSAVSGMPIGAQLPIKQAERIEVIFGPAAAIYGADASAGVVNIILKENERPIFAQADLSIGTNSFTNLDVSFGGKLGKDKNVLRFNVYGSNTVFDDREIIYDNEKLYDPTLYNLGPNGQPSMDDSFAESRNYRGELNDPAINELPHLSRNFGFNLKYRSLYFSFDRLYRVDHSSLGLSPLAVAYYNPLTFTGEEILKFHGQFQKDLEKISLTTNVSYLKYQLDSRSSNLYISNSLGQVVDGLSNVLFPDDSIARDSMSNFAFDNFFSRLRFSYAESQDVRVEQLVNYTPSNNTELVFGVIGNIASTLPLVNYLPVPFSGDVEFDSDWTYEGNAPIAPSSSSVGDISAFAQVYLTYPRWNAILGAQYAHHGDYGGSFSPRFAALYKANDRLSFRASYGSAFRAPSPYFRANTYILESADLSEIKTFDSGLQQEETSSFEFGSRWVEKKFRADVAIFYSTTENFISFNFNEGTNLSTAAREAFAFGYFNDADSKSTVFGLQSNFQFRDIIPANEFTVEASLSYNGGSEDLPFGLGELEDPRSVPQLLGQVDLSFKVADRFYVNLVNIFMSESINRRVVRARILTDANRDRFINQGYYNLDILARLPFSDNLQGYLKIRNIFNAAYAGIGATGTIDDLAYNPQSLRTWNLGLSYRMF